MHSSQSANKDGPEGLSPAKTAKERKALERARKAAQGLKEVRGIWATSSGEAKIKAFAKNLNKVKGP